MKENLYQIDSEFFKRFEAFAFDEVVNEPGIELDNKSRYMAILASLIGCLGMVYYKVVLAEALEQGVTPIEVKEIVYQSVAYVGMGQAFEFLEVTNKVFLERGIELPLEDQATTTMNDRLEKGIQAQVDIFGDNMKEFYKGGHINRWLAANCFGDYYTRDGLDLKQREMITFCFLAALGGGESQLGSHAAGNMNLGNDKQFLIKVISQCLPYVGYPKSLNAITTINKVAEMFENQ